MGNAEVCGLVARGGRWDRGRRRGRAHRRCRCRRRRRHRRRCQAMAAGRRIEKDLRMEARGGWWGEEAGPLAKGRGSVL